MDRLKFKSLGVIKWNGYTYKYYSQRVLPGGGLKIPGRHVDNYFVCDEEDYICVAAHPDQFDKGDIVDTPFGEGKVYDACPEKNVIDIYTDF